MKKLILSLKAIFTFTYFFICIVFLLSCNHSESVPEDNSSYVSSIEKWQEMRIQSLKNDVLTVVGYFRLQEGENSFGSNPSNDILFPRDKSPEFIGLFILHDGQVQIKIKPGGEVLYEGEAVEEMELQNDFDGKPTVLHLGQLSWYIHKISGEFGVRLCDHQNPDIHQFKGISTYAIDPVWRVEARFKAYEGDRKIEVTTKSGLFIKLASPGALKFKINEQEYQLDIKTWPTLDRYFLIFGDETNGDETYEGGRFLVVEKAGDDGITTIDFNKAFNPPCALSNFYSCPLPPSQNRLPIKVTAGEKKYKGSIHKK